jgi:hypothetical protein
MDINITIENIINKHFINLNITHKKLLVLYLSKLVYQLYKYYTFDNFKEQLLLNSERDIIGLLVLLLPYFNLDHIKSITSLDIIYFNKDNKGRDIESTFYIDHGPSNAPLSIRDLLETSFNHIVITFKKTKNKLLCNWLNVFPYTIETIETNTIYTNLRDLYLQHTFDDEEGQGEYSNITFSLGYDTLHGTINNFLYEDIFKIKWLIYDVNYVNGILPNIIYIADLLGIHNIINMPYHKLPPNQLVDLVKRWDMFKNNLVFMKSLLLFYMKWDKDENNLEFNLSRRISTQLDEIYKETTDENNVDNLIYNMNKEDIQDFIENIKDQIKLERIYEYIYTCMQQFRYTWYGFKCLDENKNILSIEQFKSKYIPLYRLPTLPTNNQRYREMGYITPKMFYNYFKSLIHISSGNDYIRINSHWDMTDSSIRTIFINRMNGNNLLTWFNIQRNLGNLYEHSFSMTQFMRIIGSEIYNKDYIPRIIIETLIQNGILTYVKYNPKVTDKTIIPDKNKRNREWRNYITDNIDIANNMDGYHFLNNMKFKHINNYEINIKKHLWFTNFGGDWVAQIQTFHHFIHQRVLFVTGATGAGKSTVVPQLFLYAFKALNYNSNAKIYCSQPRIQPTTDNAKRIAEQLGVPIIEDVGEDEGVGKGAINYIQYKHSKRGVVDDKYHLTLRLLTDGTLLQLIMDNMLLKKSSGDRNNKIISLYNAVDMILVDEAHEHNPNMDMILTFIKFGVYINNQVSLGIISATMENDELTYRKYYELIDDNWKFPLNVNKNIQPYGNRNLLDRRLHLSSPFQTTNFTITEVEDIAEPVNMNASILKNVIDIIKNKGPGDILIFKSSANEIIELVSLLNSNPDIPSNVLAIPFYSTLKTDVLNMVKEIAKPDIRNSIKISKNANFNDYFDINEKDKVNVTYTRFLIVATNIAEASITIDTLKYVIDTGNEVVVGYDILNDTSNNKKESITESSRKQRKGRIGRVAPGTIYYKYDHSILSNKPNYKICIQNIQSIILDMIVTANSDKIKIIDRTTDPNMSNVNGDAIANKVPFLVNQYLYLVNINGSFDVKKFGIINKNDRNVFEVVYPYDNCKYDCETVIDENGTFYIISPNELQITRNENLKIVKRNDDYVNKVSLYLDVLKQNRFMTDKCTFTDYYRLCNEIKDMFDDIYENKGGSGGEEGDNSLTLKQLQLFVEFIRLMRNNYNCHESLLFTICDILNINKANFKSDITYNKYSEILNICYQIPLKYYNILSYKKIAPLLTHRYKQDQKLVKGSSFKQIVRELTYNIFNNVLKKEIIVNSECSNDLYKILEYYYLLKIKLEFIVSSFTDNTLINPKIKVLMDKYESPIKLCTLQSLNKYEQFCYILVSFYDSYIFMNIPQTKLYVYYKYVDATQAIESRLKCLIDKSFIQGMVLIIGGTNLSFMSYIPPHILKLVKPIKRTIIKIDKVISLVPNDENSYKISYYTNGHRKEGTLNKNLIRKLNLFIKV